MKEIKLYGTERFRTDFTNSINARHYYAARHFSPRRISETSANLLKKQTLFIFSGLIFIIIFLALIAGSSRRVSAQDIFQVEAVSVEPSPAEYVGACPGTITFTAKIQAVSGRGLVKYRWLRSDGAASPVEYIEFAGPGAGYATTTWTLGDAGALPNYAGWQQIEILSPNKKLSNKAEFKLTCSQSSNPNEKKPENNTGSLIEKKIPDFSGNKNTPKPDAPDCMRLPNGCPPEQPTARFRVTINGFKTNRRTNDKFLDEDGAKDEVFLRTDASLYDIWTNRNQPMRMSPVIGDSNTRPERIRAGRASSIGGGNGGFEDGDGFPSSVTPWVRVSAPTENRPPMLAWEGDLTRDGTALALIPSIWESDEDSRILFNQWTSSVAATFAGIGADMRQAIARRSGFQPSREMQNSLNRFFDAVRIPNAGNNDLDRPLGMDFRGGQYGYAPQMLVLTYDAAERISRTDAGFGAGIIELRFKDQGELVGDYSIFAQVERLDGNANNCAADLSAVFNGTATMTTSHGNARGPFSQRISLGINAANCRSTLTINQFPAITATFPTPVGDNTATLTLIGGGTGSLNPANGRIEIPVRLRLGNTNAFGGTSTIELTLSTENADGMRKASGRVTLTGSGTFRGGFLDGQTGRFSVTGEFSPTF